MKKSRMTSKTQAFGRMSSDRGGNKTEKCIGYASKHCTFLWGEHELQSIVTDAILIMLF